MPDRSRVQTPDRSDGPSSSRIRPGAHARPDRRPVRWAHSRPRSATAGSARLERPCAPSVACPAVHDQPGAATPPADADDQAAPALVLTGERTLPGIWHENYWFQRHLVAYERVAPLADGATVLDAGCGEGYGLRVLAEAGADRVVGVDLDEAVVHHARATYGDPGGEAGPVVEVHAAELMSLPLADDEVDLTVSFQVIEHLHDIPGYLASLRRVTRPGGRIVIATPNRLTFTPDGDTPTNPFHTIEFTADELRAELARAGLDVVELVGVHHGILLSSVAGHHRPSIIDLQLAAPPEQWPSWLRQMVERTRTKHFDVHDRDLDASLDLIATCVVPAAGTSPGGTA